MAMMATTINLLRHQTRNFSIRPAYRRQQHNCIIPVITKTTACKSSERCLTVAFYHNNITAPNGDVYSSSPYQHRSRLLRRWNFPDQQKQQQRQQRGIVAVATTVPLLSITTTAASIFSREQQKFTSPSVRSSSTSNSTASTNANTAVGEEKYREALEAMEKANEIRLEKERAKSEEMYKAWKRATDKQTEYQQQQNEKNQKQAKKKSLAAGVAVVKTIVKQTRKEVKKQTRQQTDEEYWKQQGRTLLEEAALTYHHPEALVRLGNEVLQEEDNSVEKDAGESSSTTIPFFLQQALDLYRKAGEHGSPEGWFNLGQLLWTGYPAVEEDDVQQQQEQTDKKDCLLQPNREAAMQAFWKAISAGDVDAMYFVGVQLLSSVEDDYNHDNQSDNDVLEEAGPVAKNVRETNMKATKEELERGLELIQTAAKEGHGGALYYLALLHLNGLPVLNISCSEETFARYLNAAVEAGDADAMFVCGHCYYSGTNPKYYPQDYAKALEQFMQSAKNGNAEAAVSAGAMLHSSNRHKYPGIQSNPSQAFQFYQRAGELGNIEGWRNVVACYALGEGVPKCEETAKYIAKTMLK